uniref:Olfactory receptor family 10 subfamily Q member 1 n=1 Tax=Pseudonaja textilis TaxID=8673 RepID=A0A670YVZ5_PSETE
CPIMYLTITNWNNAYEFLFQPFSTVPEIQYLIFPFFLLLYLIILSGNISILSIIYIVNSLHTLMNFFLASLSFLEICYTTMVVPPMLASISDFHRKIPLVNCALQMFFFTSLGSTDCFMLAVMAYDRYVAICHPLCYTLIMTWRVCIWLVIGSLILAIVLCLQRILAWADTQIHQTVLYNVGIMVLTIPFLLICISYVYIMAAIFQIKSTLGRHQPFSTCSSHLTVVILQYGVCSLVYLHPKSSTSEDDDRNLALIYTFVTTLLNSLIYTLRNKDIKQALRKVMKKMVTSQT